MRIGRALRVCPAQHPPARPGRLPAGRGGPNPGGMAIGTMDAGAMSPAAARAALEWLVECGADEAILEAPVDRTALPDRAPGRPPRPPRRSPPPGRARPGPPRPRGRRRGDLPDAVAAAERAAAGAADLPALRAALEAYPHCDLRRGARSLVFADGTPGAPLMILGEAPGREEDRAGRPFAGPAGQLLDRMLAAIGRDRADPDPARSVYLADVLPWRLPGDRAPSPEEMAMLAPFARRHVALAAPRVVVPMGNAALGALTGRTGIARLRGTRMEAGGVTAIPTFHPAHLLRSPERKRDAWADLQAIRDLLLEGA